MTMREYLNALRRHWVAIIVFGVVGGVVGFAYAQTLPLLYRSTASVMIIPVRGDSTAELVQGSSYVQSLVQSYAALASKPVVLQPVIDELGLEQTPYQLSGSVSVSAPLDTVVIDISVVQHDPKQAQAIATGITGSLADAVTQLSPKGDDGKAAVRTAVIAPAQVPNAPFAPNARLYGIVGAIIGALVGVVYALVRRLINGRVASAEDIADVVDVPVMGEIIGARRNATAARSLIDDPDGQVAESFRSLAANLRFANVDGAITVLLISSSQPGEGKSTVAIGLALAIAESGQRVLLVDADLRRPTLAKIAQLESAVGITTVLLGDVDLADAVQPWGRAGLDVLASGALPPNPGQLLASGHLRSVIEDARGAYDLVIVDSPPVLAVSDALWLAGLSDGVLVTARAGKSTRRKLSQTISSLGASHAPVVGVALNGVKGRLNSPYYSTESTPKSWRTFGLRDRRTGSVDDGSRTPASSVETDEDISEVDPASASPDAADDSTGPTSTQQVSEEPVEQEPDTADDDTAGESEPDHAETRGEVASGAAHDAEDDEPHEETEDVETSPSPAAAPVDEASEEDQNNLPTPPTPKKSASRGRSRGRTTTTVTN